MTLEKNMFREMLRKASSRNEAQIQYAFSKSKTTPTSSIDSDYFS